MTRNGRHNGNGHKTETPDVSHIRNVEVTHETSDISVKGVMMFVIVLSVSIAIVSGGVWIMFRYFNAEEAKEPQPGPMALQKNERLPPEPRLQTNPRADLRELRESEEKRLDSYGWVDRNAGIVHIPIEDAIKLTLQRGLPSRPATEQQVVK